MDFKKRGKQCSTMELLPHDLIEEILERLPTKSLLRFKSVSKQWKSTIESRLFQHNHLIHHRKKSKTPDLLMVKTYYINTNQILKSILTLELESPISRNIPLPWENNLPNFCQNSIDGLVCLFNGYDSVIIFNPTTRWFRTLPQSTYQQRPDKGITFSKLGFGKDEINGLYKPVWLYNSSELGKNNNATTTTTCEVFDFKINAWRFVEPSSPKRISVWDEPVYLNGLLYWLTEEDEENRSVLSLDLHTETFEFVCEAPIFNMVIFNLDDKLCGTNLFDVNHVIWSWNLEEKTWKKIYYIDLFGFCTILDSEDDCMCKVRPLAVVEEKRRRRS